MKCNWCEGKGTLIISEHGIPWVKHCSICNGTGQVVKCVTCNGVGEITLSRNGNWNISPCMVCIGNGMVPQGLYRCSLCKGTQQITIGLCDDAYPVNCDCTIKELMEREDGSKSNYYYELHNMR